MRNLNAVDKDEYYRKLNLRGYRILRINGAFIEKIIALLPHQLIVLTGVSCSGKSTIGRTLAATEKDIIHIDADTVNRRICLQQMQEFMPELFEHSYSVLGEELAYYMFCYAPDDFIVLKNIASISKVGIDKIQTIQRKLAENKELLQIVKRNITDTLLQQVIQHMLLGKVVILDLVVDKDSLKPFISLSPLVVTIYRPLRQLVESAKHRIQSAEDNSLSLEKRDIKNVYAQSYGLFAQRNGPQNRIFIHTRIKTDLFLNTSELDISQSVSLIQRFLNHQPLYRKQLGSNRHIVLDRANVSPKLILLDGLSTAGKTTTAVAFMRLHQSTVLLRRSDRQRKLLLEAMPKTVVQENPFDERIFCLAKGRKNIGFRKLFPTYFQNLSSDYLERVENICIAMQDGILKQEEQDASTESKELLLAGINVMLDNLIFKDNISAFDHLSPVIVLIYCPFDNIIDHIMARNTEAVERGNPIKWRDPYRVYLFFTKLFGVVNKFKLSAPLEILSKAQVQDTLNIIFDRFPPTEHDFKREAFTIEIMRLLNLDQNNSVAIYPLLTRPDFILKTSNPVEYNVQRLSEIVTSSNTFRPEGSVRYEACLAYSGYSDRCAVSFHSFK